MKHDSLALLEPKVYEENTYMGGVFDNPRDSCFYASLYGGYLVTINTINQ
jgi:hypothetical protein